MKCFSLFALLLICSESLSVIRVTSWNLLAQCYAKSSKYSWCSPEELSWEHRKSLIIPAVKTMDADIICLQEVQVDLWPDLYQEFQASYEGHIQNVTQGHQLASAILIKNDCPLQVERLESRSRVLIAVLSDDKKRMVYLCNVHLEAGEKDFDNMQRYHQLKSLFKRLSRQIRATCDDSVENANIILAGDFNMLRTNPLHTFLSQGLLQSPEQIKNLPPASTIQLFDAFLDPTIGGTAQPRPSELLHTDSCFFKEEEAILKRTYANGHVLDYIWHSSSVQISRTLLFHPAACNNERQKWPCHDHPSDHLPIGVDIEWNDEQ